MLLNFLNFANLRKMAKDFAEMTKSVVVDEKISLQYLAHILVVLQRLKDFTYIAFKGLLCGNFVDLAVHHIE